MQAVGEQLEAVGPALTAIDALDAQVYIQFL